MLPKKENILNLLGVSWNTWKAMTITEQLYLMNNIGVQLVDVIAAGALGSAEDMYRKGYYRTIEDARRERKMATERYHDKINRRAQINRFEAHKASLYKTLTYYNRESAEEEAKSLREHARKRRRQEEEYAMLRHHELADIEEFAPYKRGKYENYHLRGRHKRHYDETLYDQSESSWAGLLRIAENDAKVSRTDQAWLEMDADTNILRDTPAPTAAPAPEPVSNEEHPNMENPMRKYKATRVKTEIVQNRRASKYASMKYAIRAFWRNRMPLLTLRTYWPIGGTNWLLTANSAAQAVYPPATTALGADMEKMKWEFPISEWCHKILQKMQKDMVAQHTNGGGTVHPPGNDQAISAENRLRMGLSVLEQTRLYSMMNITNTIAFVEVYEFVWKTDYKENFISGGVGIDIPNDPQFFHPSALWHADCQADDPTWGNTYTTWSATDQEAVETTPGMRPNNKCKSLFKFWDLEKKTKYVLGPGQLLQHAVHLPAMYLAADDIAEHYANVGGGSNNFYPVRFKNKTRHVMFIIHGQIGFENSTTGSSEGRIEFVPATVSIKFRQLTKLRIQEAGYKSHVMYTCAHDLTSAGVEHLTLGATARVLHEDAADLVTPAGQH